LLTDTPSSATVTLQTPVFDPSISVFSRNSSFIQGTGVDYNAEVQQDIGPFLQQPGQPEVVLQTLPYAVIAHDRTSQPARILMRGYSIDQATPHVLLQQGRLPYALSRDVEIAIPPDVAAGLHVGVGSTINILLFSDAQSIQQGTGSLSLHVVGIFTPLKDTDTFWHDTDFRTLQSAGAFPEQERKNEYQVLVSSNTLVSAVISRLDRYSFRRMAASLIWSLNWYYTLDTTYPDAGRLQSLMTGLSNLQANVPVIASPLNRLQAYYQRIVLLLVPSMILMALIVSIILLFIGMISHQLIDNRSEAIAIMRSRGASRLQVFATFLIQQCVVELVVLLIAPLIAIPTALLLAYSTLPTSNQNITELFVHNLSPQLGFIGGCSLVAVLMTFCASTYAIYRATKLDVLSLRRRVTRVVQRPFWQRYHLDIFAALFALSGYSLTLYEVHMGPQDEQTQLFFLSPLILVSAILTILTCLLLFLRVLPFLLEWAAVLAARLRSATPALALLQMARAPLQAVGTTLLLSFTTAFAIFTLLFISAQAQHAGDIATYMVGADFSGTLGDARSLREQTDIYSHVPGVASAAVGYSTVVLTDQDDPIGLQAVDTTTFAKTVIWPDQDMAQSPTSLLDQLHKDQPLASEGAFVPAIVDARTWDTLQLQQGTLFTLSEVNKDTFQRMTVTFLALGEVPRIPTLSQDLLSAGTTYHEGVLVDFRTYAAVVSEAEAPEPYHIVPNYFWLRAQQDATAPILIRASLNKMHSLNGTRFYDRLALLHSLYQDPLYLTLLGVLKLGAVIPLLLALVGCLLLTWQNMRRRLTNFTILRALGTAPRQLVGMLTWEQVPLYLLLILLGMATGWLLSVMTLPALILSSVTTGTLVALSNLTVNDLTIASVLPSLHMNIPDEVGIVICLLVAVCVVALGLMVRAITRVSIMKTLRLDED
ncbi:MAG TPA: FtsX-like permease family protein, partial [Ktedonobacteraceae bacterium]|nr:FtsX-like permease family protein [Ktedonobacteraceae bacterium]